MWNNESLTSLDLSRNELGLVGAKWVVLLLDLIPPLLHVTSQRQPITSLPIYTRTIHHQT